MAIIHMDTDQVDATLNAFRTAQQHLNEALQRLSASAEQLTGAWEGAAQAQFTAAWQEWRQGMSHAIEIAQPIIAGIERERNELFEADQASSYN